MRGMKGDMPLSESWMLFILMITIAVVASFYALDKIEDTGFGQNGQVDGDTPVSYSSLEHKVTEKQLVSYLQDNAGDKLENKGELFYEMGIKYDVDPAFAVGVARKETSLAKDTCQGISQDCNNFFCLKYAAAEFTGLTNGKCEGTDAIWSSFETPEKGIEAFFMYVSEKYINGDPPQDTIAEMGCAPGSGISSHCYCWNDKEQKYCEDWVSGKYSVSKYTEDVRSYEVEENVEPVA